ncbi:hypothetical protein C8J57DRAFT_1727344 [Mycena rebaudengoi]|nr:hypothetical protein C8J57DRAFT_1727344 [Mycena rebaudengoi]
MSRESNEFKTITTHISGGKGGKGGQGGVEGGGGGAGEGPTVKYDIKAVENFTTNIRIQSDDTVLEVKLERWLNAPDPKEKHARSCGLRQKSTCLWLLRHQSFVHWQDNPGKLLWIEGPWEVKDLTKTDSETDSDADSGTDSDLRHDALDFLPASVMHAFTAALAFALGTFVHEEAALASAGSLGALVVRAMSGTGKTILSSAVIEELFKHRRNNTAIAYFYFDFSEDSKQKNGRTYLILDALDECNNHDIITSFVQKITAWPDIRLHVLVANVEKLLHWIVYSAWPLTVAELEDTIAFDFSDSAHYIFDPEQRTIRGTFMQWMSGLVSVTHPEGENILDTDGVLRDDCIHPVGCNTCPIRVSAKVAHPLMAETCIDYLLHFADPTHPLNVDTFPHSRLFLVVASFGPSNASLDLTAITLHACLPLSHAS